MARPIPRFPPVTMMLLPTHYILNVILLYPDLGNTPEKSKLRPRFGTGGMFASLLCVWDPGENAFRTDCISRSRSYESVAPSWLTGCATYRQRGVTLAEPAHSAMTRGLDTPLAT